MTDYPHWLEAVAWTVVCSGVVSALLIAWDIAAGRRQRMWIMNVVWPLTALYSSVLGLWAYFRIGRPATRSNEDKPFWQSAVVGALHCGSGCTLGDLLSESFVILVPVSLFGQRIFGAWLVDYLAAFSIGILFQYFSIKPMRNLSPWAGLQAAIKADVASLSAWQVGMYGWMAIATFLIFDHELPKSSPVFWFMMQIAMLFGFATAYPVNALLIKRGIKERM